jgi:glycine oxidase
MARYDVIVLGGGIIGCAIAEELAQLDQRVVVMERGTIGAEASSAAAGILSAQMDLVRPGPFFDLCQSARRLYPHWVRRLEQNSGLSVGLHQDGILYLALTEREERMMTARAAWQRQRRLTVQRWSPAEVRRHEPSVDGRLRCGFYFPTEAQIDNVQLMEALSKACRRAGVTLMEETRVRRLRLQRRIVQGVETDRGSVRAPVVINCLGSWASLIEPPPIKLPVVPARGQMLAFTGPKGLFRSAVMSEQAYVVQRRDGRLIGGSTVEFVGFQKCLTLAGIHAILSGLRRMTSVLDRCTFVDAWAGLRPCSKDQLPLIGKTSIDGLYLATGHFRHGILLAPLTATLIADLLLNGQTPFALSAFALERFS